MIQYRVKYDIESETHPLVKGVDDTVTVEYPMGETELAAHLSLMYALVRGETNDLTNLVILVAREQA
jgi:hypothetical protein